MKYYFVASFLFFATFLAIGAAQNRDDDLLELLERVLKDELENTVDKVSIWRDNLP